MAFKYVILKKFSKSEIKPMGGVRRKDLISLTRNLVAGLPESQLIKKDEKVVVLLGKLLINII